MNLFLFLIQSSANVLKVFIEIIYSFKFNRIVTSKHTIKEQS